MAKQVLMKLDQIRPILVSHFGHFLLGQYGKAKRGEEKKKKKKRKGMETTFVWNLFMETNCVWITVYL